MTSKQHVKNPSTGNTVKPFTISGSLSARMNDEEIAALLELRTKLSTDDKPITNHRELITAMVHALQTRGENGADAAAERVKELEKKLQRYSSIDITQLSADNQNLQNQVNSANNELTKVKEEFEQFKLTVDTTNEKFNTEHYCLAVNDTRLHTFFAGSNARIAAGKKNPQGRVVTCHEDTIEDLAAFAAKYAHKSELFNS